MLTSERVLGHNYFYSFLAIFINLIKIIMTKLQSFYAKNHEVLTVLAEGFSFCLLVAGVVGMFTVISVIN